MNEHVRHFEDAAKEQVFSSASASKNVAQSVADMLHETIDYYAQAVQDFTDHASDLSKTRDLRDAWKLQSDFAEKQRSAAMRQFERLTAVSREMIASASGPLQTARRTAEATIDR